MELLLAASDVSFLGKIEAYYLNAVKFKKGEIVSFWDNVHDKVFGPVASVIVKSLENTVQSLDCAVNNAIIDGICDRLDTAVDFVKENPGKVALAAAATAATGGMAFVAAGPIAAAIGSTGLLGTAGTGAVISELTGIYLANASLAALGGGTLASGGAGMAGGVVVVAASGAVAGATASGAVLAATSV